MVCQQHAADIEDPDNEKRIGELADEKVSAADLEIVFAFTEVSIADNSGQRWNEADDGVGREDCRPELAKQNCQVKLEDHNHHAEIREATEVSAADNTGESGHDLDEQFWHFKRHRHNVCGTAESASGRDSIQ